MKSRKWMLAAAAAACCFSLAAQADCVLPPAPSKIPDGSTASEQEMITAMQTLKEYNTDIDTYLKCLQFETKQNRLSAGDQEKMHNTAVDTLQKVAAKGDEQGRTFKSKKG